MRARISHVRCLSQRERFVLRSLRGATRGGDVPDVFAQLAQEAKVAGLCIGGTEAIYITDDERLILAWLAILQRQRVDDVIGQSFAVSPELLDLLGRCADLLDEAGCHLEFRNAQRARPVVDAVRANTMQARVIRFVTENGTSARRDLTAFGASPALLRTMCRRRLLRRVTHGCYGLGQLGQASAESAVRRAPIDQSIQIS